MVRVFKLVLLLAFLFLGSDATNVKNRDEGSSKVRTKKRLTKLPRNMKNARSVVNQNNNKDLVKTARELQLGGGEIKAMFGFSHSTKSSKSHSYDDDGLSIDIDSGFLNIFFVFFLLLLLGGGNTTTNP
eukprot:CAMPEP_0178959274 /NCGR_PEP_ID=MMETSP0789-20121207/12188_1 /TAXON_ID=3005 /ORGANISM="Rhizosolenia setigera, Strain CCMP 1694" /LENGTH=128 /DNA_ID=CAMNT_0020642235 /DNA_START=33 /DNA_END=419 /DNA_ORIENTATION=-